MVDDKVIPFRRPRTDEDRRAEANGTARAMAHLEEAVRAIDERLSANVGEGKFILVAFLDRGVPLADDVAVAYATNASDELALAHLKRLVERKGEP